MQKIFTSFCNFVENEYARADKVKVCVAAFVDDKGLILSHTRNTYECCAERNLIESGCPQCDCNIIVIRMHKNSHGTFIKNSKPCGKCVDGLSCLPKNIKYIIWSDHDSFSYVESNKVPVNLYKAHNQTLKRSCSTVDRLFCNLTTQEDK